MSPLRAAIRITLIYVGLGLVWILFSDQALMLLVDDTEAMLRLQTYKGWTYVLVTGVLFGLLAWRSLHKQRQMHERDALTGLLNWYMFRSVVDEQLQSAKNQREELAITILNIDGFRQLNSQIGQRNGDLILQHLAEKLRAESPTHASIGRVAADEFCISLRGQQAVQDLTHIVERVQRDMQSGCNKIFQSSRLNLSLSCSAGIAGFPQDASHTKELITSANLALAEAKDLGHGHLCSYRQAYSDSVRHRAQLIRDLEQVIYQAEQHCDVQHDLYMAYQPQFNDPTKPMSSVEALLRWSHPLHGNIPPDQFIELAEQHGLISRLTDFVCRRVIHELGTSGILKQLDYVSINISAHDINSPTAEHDFKRRFELNEQTQQWVTQGKVQLEITETALMQNKERARSLLEQLRARGYRISIDDFGTGYSSLSVVSRLPVNELKIDRSFISEIEQESELLIVRTIIAMAHALNLEVVAEGVENETQISILNSLACNRLQGYYLGRPVPLAQLKALHGTGHSSSQSSP